MRRGARQGIALLNVLIFTFITTSFLVVAIQFTSGALKQGRAQRSDVQVYNVALAGINHAVFWLQKQDQTAPVPAFDPRTFDPMQPDEDGETPEQGLGLVKEFAIDETRRLWGRYEVARSQAAPARDGLATGPASPLYTDPISWSADDISVARGGEPGTIWRVRSRGYVYERKDETVPFSPTSPAPLDSIMLEAEVKKASLRFRPAAVYSFLDGAGGGAPHLKVETENTSGDTTHIEILTGGSAYHFWSNSDEYDFDSDVVFVPDPRIVVRNASNPGVPSTFVPPNLADQLDYYFGASTLEDVRSLATHIYEDANDVPSPQPAPAFIYIKPNGGGITFKNGGGQPTLDGSGILFIEGDLTIDGDSNLQRWKGLIFVTGDYTQKKASEVTGAVVCGGKFSIKGDGSKHAKILYSRYELDRLLSHFSTFVLNKATLRVADGAATTY